MLLAIVVALAVWGTTRAFDRMVLVRDIAPGELSSNPMFLTDVAGTLFYTADDGNYGQEL